MYIYIYISKSNFVTQPANLPAVTQPANLPASQPSQPASQPSRQPCPPALLVRLPACLPTGGGVVSYCAFGRFCGGSGPIPGRKTKIQAPVPGNLAVLIEILE